MANIEYKNTKFANTYSSHRTTWEEFYESEKHIIEQCGISLNDTILDLGCACGGLGLALNEKFSVTDYTGIDINQFNIERGAVVNPTAKLYHGDFLDNQFDSFVETFDLVISLGCVDWNVEFDLMLDRAWSFVNLNGHLIVSIRMTDMETVKDITRSYQHIDDTEIAQYNIINVNEMTDKFQSYDPIDIKSYGYWLPVKSNVVTVYKQIYFAVFAVKKKREVK